MTDRPPVTGPTMERNDGLRRVLSLGSIYRASQWAIGADRFFGHVGGVVASTGADDVVDIGCGTGDLADHIAFRSYTGFDPNPSYVERASTRLRAAHGDAATAIVGALGDPALPDLLPPRADVVTAIGVFHHLDDELVDDALRLAVQLLEPGGRFVSADPAIVTGQHRVARALAQRDRGQHVRSPEEVEALVRGHFDRVEVDVRHDLLRVPYTHVIVRAERT